ncbi:D-sedoheptulose 7-phosphate isomerase [Bathymodiolus japonicus methanotrophic gill symbiont]|uniref:D-sedoheptulose-7-phosphate isomerase n=1 Tax=Bathymodiolus japonicus methanotrophic gill symbiont TaxID=113269 RepID=UPI001B4A2EA3|nr:SIS domain-containing protein [Bathymodiolus japonicus methanotrophic gill symbiont]GFO73124.1 D-sedoheptulose 7-phosphate isomerase [Bathymodiolus japonicus methanotrophic gill symbiont]
MSSNNNIKQQITESIHTQQLVLDELSEVVEFAAQHIVNALLADRKILSAGNAASVSNVQYFTVLMINRYDRVRPSLPAISLVNDVQMLTSIANTQHYDDVYAKQLRALGQADDVLLVYNVEGSALNLVKLINAAHDKQIIVILLVGESETTLPALLHEVDVCINVPSQSAQRIHEAHLLITHCLCDLVDSQLFGNTLL